MCNKIKSYTFILGVFFRIGPMPLSSEAVIFGLRFGSIHYHVSTSKQRVILNFKDNVLSFAFQCDLESFYHTNLPTNNNCELRTK